jgi:predicted Zn-dependent protease
LHQSGPVIRHLKQAVRGFPDQVFLKAMLGEAEVDAGDVKEGLPQLKDLDAAGNLTEASSYTALAIALETTGDLGAAQKAVEKALSIHPRDVHAAKVQKRIRHRLAPTDPHAKSTPAPLGPARCARAPVAVQLSPPPRSLDSPLLTG